MSVGPVCQPVPDSPRMTYHPKWDPLRVKWSTIDKGARTLAWTRMALGALECSRPDKVAREAALGF